MIRMCLPLSSTCSILLVTLILQKYYLSASLGLALQVSICLQTVPLTLILLSHSCYYLFTHLYPNTASHLSYYKWDTHILSHYRSPSTTPHLHLSKPSTHIASMVFASFLSSPIMTYIPFTHTYSHIYGVCLFF
jgi:hypothetical protein